MCCLYENDVFNTHQPENGNIVLCGNVDLSQACFFTVDLSIIQMNDGNEKYCHVVVSFFFVHTFASNASIASPSINEYFRFFFLNIFYTNELPANGSTRKNESFRNIDTTFKEKILKQIEKNTCF